jgi:hypothetical protein
MRKRIKQFIRALGARITPADRTFIAEHLNPAEQAVFYGMSLQDQFHCRRVAEDILRLAEGRNDVDRRFLIRCALLHDAGRRWGDVSTWDKIAAVLLHYFFPEQTRAWAREGRGTRLENLRHALHVSACHPQRGVALLRPIGVEPELLAVIGAHHESPTIKDPPALTLLQRADDLN